jgi:hypothetical protein
MKSVSLNCRFSHPYPVRTRTLPAPVFLLPVPDSYPPISYPTCGLQYSSRDVHLPREMWSHLQIAGYVLLFYAIISLYKLKDGWLIDMNRISICPVWLVAIISFQYIWLFIRYLHKWYLIMKVFFLLKSHQRDK